MARKKRRFTSKRQPSSDSNDISLNDFANAPVNSGGGRLKKNKAQSVLSEVAELEDDRPWYEKVEDLAIASLPKKNLDRQRKCTLETEEDSENCIEYPVDIWYLISEHIDPEDVGRFAGICRNSNNVVNSAKFWFSLYKRFYRPVENLPEILKPSCMVRRYGLRALVIRSLYYFYRPFRNRLHNTANSDPHRVVGRQCIVAWTHKIKGRDHWIYSFKMKLIEPSIHGRRDSKPKPDLWDMLDDISANVDKDCKILQVKSNSYHPLPMLSGQVLLECLLKVSADCGSYNLQMQFGCGPSNYQSCSVCIRNVTSVLDLDWWHPSFTHSESLHGGLFRSTIPKDSDFSEVTKV